jgi:hypothetical protein
LNPPPSDFPSVERPRKALLVRRASDPRYEGFDLFVRVPPSAGKPLTKEDIRTSLWEGRSIAIIARCEGDRFVADDVQSYPG